MGGKRTLSVLERVLAQGNVHGHRFRLVLDSADDDLPQSFRPEAERKAPIYGHVSDDMAQQFSGGKSGGPTWE